MKNLFNIGFIVLLLVVLGCNCQKIQELANESRNTPPPPTVSNTSTVPTKTDAPTKTSADSTISMGKYNQIKNDMKKSEVENIIGSAGEEISSSSGGGFTFSTYKWSGENYSTIIISYKNDRVMSKSQFGLK